MDFHSMTRKKLQALCKKHKIPANLKNVEMADRLASLLKVGDEKPKEQIVKPCLKSLEEGCVIVIDEENSEGKEHKKVRFCPQNETFVFEKTNPRAVRAASRRNSIAIGEDNVSKKEIPRGVGKRKLSSMKQVVDLETDPVEITKPRVTRRRNSMAIGEDRIRKERNLSVLEDVKENVADEKTRKVGVKQRRCVGKRKLSSIGENVPLKNFVDLVDDSEAEDSLNSVFEGIDIQNTLCNGSSVVEDNQGKSQSLLQTKSPSPLLDKCNSKKDVEACEESILSKQLETVISSLMVVECEPNKGEGSPVKSTEMEILSKEEDQMASTSKNLESAPLEKCTISDFSNVECQMSMDGVTDFFMSPSHVNEFESSLQKSDDSTDNRCIDHAGKNRGYDQVAEEVTPTSTVKVGIEGVLNSEPIDEERNGITAENDSILSSEVPEGMRDVSDVYLGDNHDAYNSDGSDYPSESEINHNQEEEESKIKTITEEIEVEISYVPEERKTLDVSETNDSAVFSIELEKRDMVDNVSDVQMNENHENTTVADQNLEKGNIVGCVPEAAEATLTPMADERSKRSVTSINGSLDDSAHCVRTEEHVEISTVMSTKFELLSNVMLKAGQNMGCDQDAEVVPPTTSIVEKLEKLEGIDYNDSVKYRAECESNHKHVLEKKTNSPSNEETNDIADALGFQMFDNHEQNVGNASDEESYGLASLFQSKYAERQGGNSNEVSDIELDDNHEKEALAGDDMEVYEENGIALLCQPEYVEDDNGLINRELQGGSFIEVSDVELDNGHENEGLVGENMDVDESNDAGKTCEKLKIQCLVDEEKICDEQEADFIGHGETCEDSERLLGDVSKPITLEEFGSNPQNKPDIVLQGSEEKITIQSSVDEEKVSDECGTFVQSIATVEMICSSAGCTEPEGDLIGLEAFERLTEQTDQQKGIENFALTYKPEISDGENFSFTPEMERADGRSESSNVKGVCMEDGNFPLNDETADRKFDKESVHPELRMAEIDGQCESANDRSVFMEDENLSLNDETADRKLDNELLHLELSMTEIDGQCESANDKGVSMEDEILSLNDENADRKLDKESVHLELSMTEIDGLCESAHDKDVLIEELWPLYDEAAHLKLDTVWVHSGESANDTSILSVTEIDDQCKSANVNGLVHTELSMTEIDDLCESANGNGVHLEHEISPLNDEEAENIKVDKGLVYSELNMTEIDDQCEYSNIKGVHLEDELLPLNDEATDLKLDTRLVHSGESAKDNAILSSGIHKEEEITLLMENSSLKPNSIMNQKKRSILIHGTPIRPINTTDMKENSNVHLKRELTMGDATAFRPAAKRKALGELHRK